VRIDVVPDDDHGQVDVAELERRLGDDVALVAITHVPTNGGLVTPAEAIGVLTQAAGVPFLLDACQSVGQLDLDVGRIGCDLLSATGRKYLRGPRGTGFLYASANIVDRLIPDQPDHHGADWVDPDTFRLVSGAQRYESWEHNHASWVALGVAVDEAQALGLDRIEATVTARADELRAELTNAGFSVMDLGERRCGIVTIACDQAVAVRDQLRAAGINTSVTTPQSTWYDAANRSLGNMLRISVHYLTVRDELDRLLAALAEISEAKSGS